MKLVSDTPALTYDDVLIVPQFSAVASRSLVDTTTSIKNLEFKIPVISSNMDTITGLKMAQAMDKLGGLGLIHRYMSVSDNIGLLANWPTPAKKQGCGPIAVSVGTIHNDKQRIDAVLDYTFNWRDYVDDAVICVDIAHGDSKHMMDTLKYIRSCGWKGVLMAGAVCTYDGAARLFEAGASIVRVGVGGGSACSTRLKTGCGFPQLTAVAECSKAGPTIADGGIKQPADACVVGDTKILTKDLKWVPARLIKKGDELIGFDEEPTQRTTSKLKRRHFRTAIVEENTLQRLQCMKVITDKGEVVVSTDHKWLCKTVGGNKFVWKRTRDLTIRDKIVYFGPTWKSDTSRDAGYVAGFLDGEGHLQAEIYNGKKSNCINISQALGSTSDYFAEILSNIVPVSRRPRKHYGNPKHKKQEVLAVHGVYNQLKLLGVCRPVRLMRKSDKIWEGLVVMNTQRAQVLSVEDAGVLDTYTVATSTDTFIAEGMFSHNCKALAAGATAVMIGGMLAGTDCTPDWDAAQSIGAKNVKYQGMASDAARKAFTGKTGNAEGISCDVEVKPEGSTKQVIDNIAEGIRSAMSYVGATNLKEFRENASFVQVSPATIKENVPHILH